MTEVAITALKNSLLASAQPITAAIHRTWGQTLINELYDAQSRGDVLQGIASVVNVVAGDEVFIIRSGVARLVDESAFHGAVFLAASSANTAPGTIVLDFQNYNIAVFLGSAAFATDKHVSFAQDSRAGQLDFMFTITDPVAFLHFNSPVKMPDERFTPGTSVWQPDSIGEFKMHGIFDGTNWIIDITGPMKI